MRLLHVCVRPSEYLSFQRCEDLAAPCAGLPNCLTQPMAFSISLEPSCSCSYSSGTFLLPEPSYQAQSPLAGSSNSSLFGDGRCRRSSSPWHPSSTSPHRCAGSQPPGCFSCSRCVCSTANHATRAADQDMVESVWALHGRHLMRDVLYCDHNHDSVLDPDLGDRRHGGKGSREALVARPDGAHLQLSDGLERCHPRAAEDIQPSRTRIHGWYWPRLRLMACPRQVCPTLLTFRCRTTLLPGRTSGTHVPGLQQLRLARGDLPLPHSPPHTALYQQSAPGTCHPDAGLSAGKSCSVS